MFKIGDIVRPKKGFIGDIYCFQIIEVVMNPFDDNLYKLQGIKQDLGPLPGSTSYHVNIIDQVEQLWWKEKDIELTSNIKLCYDATDINISDYNGIVLDEMGRTLLKLNNKYKEENKMNILDVYKERKKEAINKKYDNLIQEIKDSDKIQEIMQDTNRLIQEIDPDRKFSKVVFNAYTSETEEDISDMEKARDMEIAELNNLIEEVEAYFTMTTDFSERKEILKNYSIIDKKGKLNI